MIEIDEFDLIAFFGVAPSPEPAEEREFFEAPTFSTRVGDLEMEFSYSFNRADLCLTVRSVGVPDPVLEVAGMWGIESLAIERGRKKRSWLRAFSASCGVLEISVEPTIAVHVSPPTPA